MQEEVLNIAPAVDWVTVIAAFLALVTSIWAIVSAPAKKNAERLEDHGRRLDEATMRIGVLEQAQRTLPNKEDVHQLELQLSDLTGEMKAMRATMEGRNELMSRLETIVTRHEEHLLKS